MLHQRRDFRNYSSCVCPLLAKYNKNKVTSFVYNLVEESYRISKKYLRAVQIRQTNFDRRAALHRGETQHNLHFPKFVCETRNFMLKTVL